MNPFSSLEPASAPHSVSGKLLLELNQVCRYFYSGANEVRALHNVSMTIARGEFVAIMGQSGSGKSTLMNILGCLDKPSAGLYRVAGHDVSQLSVDQLSALRLKTFGFVFQRYQLLANQSAHNNVVMPAVYSGMADDERNQKASALLQQLGIEGRAHHKPSELSGGQQQRVSIARALINGAEIILADEPTGALDSASGEQVLSLLKQLHADTGATIILITHDAEVASHAERVIVMKDGELCSDSGARTEPIAAKEIGVTATPLQVFPRIGLLTSARLAFSALRANLFRTLLTLLGIIIGVASVVTMMAIGDGGKQQVLDRIAAMGTNLLQVQTGGRNIRSSGEIATLNMEDAREIALLPGVEAVAPERESRSTFRQGAFDYSGRVRGVTPEYFAVKDWQLSLGVFLDDSDVQTFASVMVLGATVAAELFPDQPNPIGKQVLMKSTPYQVIGVLKAKGASAGGRDMDDEVFVPMSTAQLKFFGSEYLSSITIKVTQTGLLASVESAVTQLLKLRHGREDFGVRNTASLVEAVTETQDTLTWLLGSVAAISLLVGGIGVMNIMLVNVSERRREIGLRIATGAKPSDILRQFNIEALLVCLLGGAIGVALGLSVSLLLQSFNIAVMFSLFPPLLAFSTSLLVGWVFGYAPAHKAASLNPISALAEE
ncbi:MacB family efflux pump subunit [Simiduia curdlanivorans]|uniref:MacB family efflux pump subunit n=1 Tax=Simiduia curdlanivorans TaxID=1492769 RepID=A0ABV8V2J4_9GAMM|nr:MacB family efflux pump subunit [Simiduia curdlanivorans]MDN3637472.1 MacB family efflux pump subunit [Simiduia curdlanivorans]